MNEILIVCDILNAGYLVEKYNKLGYLEKDFLCFVLKDLPKKRKNEYLKTVLCYVIWMVKKGYKWEFNAYYKSTIFNVVSINEAFNQLKKIHPNAEIITTRQLTFLKKSLN